MTTCPACTEEFVPSEKDEEFCSECEYEMEEGLTKILLSKDDCALIFRNDSFPEIYLCERNENDEISDAEMILVGLTLSLENEELMLRIIERILDSDIDIKSPK